MICSDLFAHDTDIAAAPCGHTFHSNCLHQWFNASNQSTCPQCRARVNVRNVIKKLYFDVAEAHEDEPDAATLENSIGNLKAQVNLKKAFKNIKGQVRPVLFKFWSYRIGNRFLGKLKKKLNSRISKKKKNLISDRHNLNTS